MSWTPGPWQVVDETTVWAGSEDEGHYILPPDDMRPDAQRPDDARLIAAAPEMAGVLQLLLTAYNHPSGDFGEDECDEAADKAAEIFTRIRGEA